MVNTIKCKLFIEDPEENIIGAEIIERNGVSCSELLTGICGFGNSVAFCRALVHDYDAEVVEGKVITITVEEDGDFDETNDYAGTI